MPLEAGNILAILFIMIVLTVFFANSVQSVFLGSLDGEVVPVILVLIPLMASVAGVVLTISMVTRLIAFPLANVTLAAVPALSIPFLMLGKGSTTDPILFGWVMVLALVSAIIVPMIMLRPTIRVSLIGRIELKRLSEFASLTTSAILMMVPTLTAHNFALRLDGLASFFYYSERIVLLVPSLFAMLAVSHFLSRFVVLVEDRDHSGAQAFFSESIRWNLIYGTISLSAMLLLVLGAGKSAILTDLVPVIGHEEFRSLLILCAPVALFRYVEMICSRALAAYRRSRTMLVISTASAFIAGILYVVLHSIGDLPTVLSIAILWQIPIAARSTFMFVCAHTAVRQHLEQAG